MAKAAVDRPVPKRTAALTLREILGLLGLFLIPSRTRSDALYKLLGAHNTLAEESLYLNLGYWRDQSTYDGACEAMAAKLGDAAELGEGDVVLDCGNGFGDQDAFWLDKHQLTRVVALNTAAPQVELARQRFPDQRLDFRRGSATLLDDFADQSFDRVLALESAFHFVMRDDFFREARRVLKPGATIATADFVRAGPRRGLGLQDWLGEKGGQALWQWPAGNLYEGDEYARRLEAAGFVDVEIEDISADVFQPFEAYARRRLDAPDVVARMNPLLRRLWKIPNSGAIHMSYVIVKARVPGD